MNRFLNLLILFLISVVGSQAQTFEIVDPSGLTPPYEVAPGTAVTFQWDYFGEPPTAVFTHDEEPVFPGWGTDPNWTEHTNYTDNGDGTFNITLSIDEDTWVFGAYFAPFIQQWTFSEVIAIQVASNVVISGDDLLLCDDNMDTETLSVVDTFAAYQWYMNGNPINGETSSMYTVTEPGAYYVQADYNGELINSNTLNLAYIELSFSGELNGNSEIILTASAGMDSYQWFSGPDENNLSPISGATDESYTATITNDLTFYTVEATLGSCTVSTIARPVAESYFTPPTITVSADTNSYNVVCEGTPVTFSVEDNYATYNWLKDGFNANSTTNTITRSQSYQEGAYSVEVTNAEWEEIILTSEVANLDFQDVITPQLVGVQNNGKYCAGETLNITLSDEGYNYTWYMHGAFNDYGDEDIITVPGSTLTFDFDTAVYVTVVGEHQGCSKSKSVYLNSYENTTLFLSVEDYDQQYLCPDSTNVIYLPSWSAGDYQDFQWYKEVGGNYEEIAGADTTFLEIDEPGSYKLQATVIACPSAIVFSNDKVIQDYSERNLTIWASDETLCVGEETDLNISGGNNWQNIQWFEENIVIGSGGYEKEYLPMIGAGSEASQTVSEFQTYLVKARHASCPNGLKLTSNIIGIRPQVNPTITPDPNYGVYSWKVNAYDSTAHYVFCTDEPTTLKLDGQYESYKWYDLVYAGADDYELGNLISGANADTLDILADVKYYTAEVDSAGCVGYSDPILMDTWAFLPPAIASYNNNELCGEGDSTLLHIAFPGDWSQIEWYLDGNLIPDSNYDSIYAKEPGTYTVTAFPTLCPQFPYSSGVGPTVSFLSAEIIANDTLIYAMPFMGAYEFQWYLNGNPIPPTDPQTPWILYKDQMEDGEYTVEITNPEPCTVLSAPYTWSTTSTENIVFRNINVYPNPTQNIVNIEGIATDKVELIQLYNIVGVPIRAIEPAFERIELDLSGEQEGIYILEIRLINGESKSHKIFKM